MKTSKIALLCLLLISASLPAYADNKKKEQPQSNGPAPSQQQQPVRTIQQRNGRGQQQSGHYATQSGHYATQAGRSATQSGHSASQSGHLATQSSRATVNQHGLASQTRTDSIRHNNALPSHIQARKVYDFQGPHRGGGRYVNGRFVGRFANDRVYVDHQWYVWEPVPIYIDGFDGYGWAVVDGPVDEEVEPVILESGPDYYIVEVNNVSSRVSREEFYRTYPHYTSVHHLGPGSTARSTSSHAGHSAQTQHSDKHHNNQ